MRLLLFVYRGSCVCVVWWRSLSLHIMEASRGWWVWECEDVPTILLSVVIRWMVCREVTKRDHKQ